MNFAQLTAERNFSDPVDGYASVKYYCNYDFLNPVEVLRIAEDAIFRKLRVREMIAEMAVDLQKGEFRIPIEDEWELLDPVGLRSTDPVLDVDNSTPERVLESRVYGYGDDGNTLLEAPPTQYAVWDGAIQFDHQADQDYPLRFVYFSTKGHRLSADNPETFLTKRHSDLMLKAIQGVGAKIKGEVRQEQEMMAQVMVAINEINVEGDLIVRGSLNERSYDY